MQTSVALPYINNADENDKFIARYLGELDEDPFAGGRFRKPHRQLNCAASGRRVMIWAVSTACCLSGNLMSVIVF